MKPLFRLITLATVAGLAAAADPPSITCKIGGATAGFSKRAKAIYDPKDGLTILGFGNDTKSNAFIGIQIPVAKPGTFTLDDTPKLSLHYSRNMWSSGPDHYDASTETKGTVLRVKVTKCGEIGKRVEGSFSAVVKTLPDREVSITQGSFSVIIERRAPSPFLKGAGPG